MGFCLVDTENVRRVVSVLRNIGLSVEWMEKLTLMLVIGSVRMLKRLIMDSVSRVFREGSQILLVLVLLCMILCVEWMVILIVIVVRQGV